MTKLEGFTIRTPRPLPVIILADTSDSMNADGKIQALNLALQEMLKAFQDDDAQYAEIHVAIIAFGGGTASVAVPLAPANQVELKPLTAAGKTPLGDAFTKVTALIEDRNLIPSRAYSPSIILLTDGKPTDEWQAPLDALLKSERAMKAARFAIAIGADANRDVLARFLADSDSVIMEAKNADSIAKQFRYVTMTVTTRTQSTNPNNLKAPSSDDLDY